MSYRFLRLYNNFNGYTQQFYAARPGLAEKPYAEQHAAMMFDAAERADFYEQLLSQRGYETATHAIDAAPMQQQWAREHGVGYAEDRWMHEIALAQIEAFQPEVLWSCSWLTGFDAAFVRAARERSPGLRLVMGWVGEWHPAAAFFSAHDLVLTCAQNSLDYLASHGIPARHLDHSFAPQVLDRLATLPHEPAAPIDVGFIGNQMFGSPDHNARTVMLYDIAREMDFALFGNTASSMIYTRSGPMRYARQLYYGLLEVLHRLKLGAVARRMPRYGAWQELKRRAPYVPYFKFLNTRRQPPVFGLPMYQTLRRFRVGLNAHSRSASASNMRLYDTTGVGTCLLTDWKANLPDLFEPGVEVVTYRSAEEAVEKARYLLDHSDARRDIAAAGQQRTLRDHTYAPRAQQLDAYIEEYMHRVRSRQ